jgi:hypothetical protein
MEVVQIQAGDQITTATPAATLSTTESKHDFTPSSGSSFYIPQDRLRNR